MAPPTLADYTRVAALGLASATVFIVASAAAVPALGSTASAPRCSTSGLVIWLNTHGSGAAGSIYYRVDLTNFSGHACALSGYPRVAAVSLRGRQIGKGSGRLVSSKPTVRLARGATVSFVLEIVDVANFPSPRCRPVTAAGLRVFPPHETASKVIPFPFRACSQSGAEYLWAQAVQPHP